jgi:putative membrane protein
MVRAGHRIRAMRLVVCVDRDDDLGRKAGVAGPVVGRQNVIDAALKLATADPEDADTNAMFAAVHLLDELREAGDEAEVVVLTGSGKVGVVSDRKVANQFDEVLGAQRAESAFLVSDGAEDEYLFPIISSRIKVDGVRRVFIRQAASLESTYYTVLRALKDPKLRQKTVLPIAMVSLILALAAAGGVIQWGFIGLAIFLGVYLIFWTFDIDEALIDSLRSASSDFRQGAVAFGFGLFAIALVGVGFLTGYNVYLANLSVNPLERLVLFLQTAIFVWLFAALVWESGRALRHYFRRARLPRSYPVATLSIVGIGLVTFGILYLVQYLESYIGGADIPQLVAALVVGFALVIGAAVLSQYLKSRSAVGDGASPG